jgi:hypothetical protein
VSDQPDVLKADLSAILNGGPAEVTADEAISRAGSTDSLHVGRRLPSWRNPHSQRRRLAAISFAVVIGLLAGYLVTGGHIGGGASSNVRSDGGPGGPGGTPAPRGVVRQVTSLPTSVYSEVNLPAEIVNYPKKVSGHEPLTADGLPELLYIWASYCPFCAAENWALVMALSKFGTFGGLKATNSSVSDFAPDTATLGFYGASYSSHLLRFESYDLATNRPASGKSTCNVNGYGCLQTAPAVDAGLLQSLGQGSFPFMDFGNEVVQDGAGYEDQALALAGLTLTQIAAQLSDPSSPVAQAEVGSANYLSAAICAMTGNDPSSVCSTPVIKKAESKEGVGTRSSGNPAVKSSTPSTVAAGSSTTTTTEPGDLEVLAPATVPPVTDECTIQLTHDADGNVTPLLCSGGGVNTLAWEHYDKGYVCTSSTTCTQKTWSKLMQLGADASAAQVYQAMCSDYKDIFDTKPLTISAEELASAYYGWHFGGESPASNFELKGCPTS